MLERNLERQGQEDGQGDRIGAGTTTSNSRTEVVSARGCGMEEDTSRGRQWARRNTRPQQQHKGRRGGIGRSRSEAEERSSSSVWGRGKARREEEEGTFPNDKALPRDEDGCSRPSHRHQEGHRRQTNFPCSRGGGEEITIRSRDGQGGTATEVGGSPRPPRKPAGGASTGSKEGSLCQTRQERPRSHPQEEGRGRK